MKKMWQETGAGQFVFLVNDETVGQYHKGDEWTKTPATFNIFQDQYTLKTSFGLFIRDNIQIAKVSGEPVLKVRNLPFTLNASFKYQDRQFRLVFNDSPLWQWSILEKDKVILAYGTDLTEGLSGLSIQTPDEAATDYLFDFLLGHLVLGKKRSDVAG